MSNAGAMGKRIGRELEQLKSSPIEGLTITLPTDALTTWHLTLAGPANTPYANGTFGIVVTLPTTYPFAPPKVQFHTRIYHPNVTNDAEGNICIAILKADAWKPASKLSAVFLALRQLLVEPNPDDPLEPRIAEEYKKQPDIFAREAASHTKRYAMAADPFAAK